jgi:transposase
VDASAAQASTDSLGRRNGPRRRRTEDEKRRIVEETLQPGASVAIIARRHELNANVVFSWRRLFQRGLLGGQGKASASLVPVRVVPPPRKTRRERSKTPEAPDSIDIRFADGMRVRVQGALAHEALRQIIASARGR